MFLYIFIDTEVCDIEGNIFTIKDHEFGYRTSIFQKSDYIILSSRLQLKYGEKEAVQDINLAGDAVVEFPIEKGGEKDQVTLVYEGKGALNLRRLILK